MIVDLRPLRIRSAALCSVRSETAKKKIDAVFTLVYVRFCVSVCETIFLFFFYSESLYSQILQYAFFFVLFIRLLLLFCRMFFSSIPFFLY